MTNRDIDALVAEKVMGLRPCSDPIGRCDGAKMVPCQCWGTPDKNGIVAGGKLSCYSTSIEAAWQVVEKFRRGVNLYAAACITLHISDCPNDTDCSCEIYGPDIPNVISVANEMPLAICLAALKAVGVEVK